MELLVDVGQVEAQFGLLGDGVNLSLGWCMVCAKCTMGIEIFLAASNGLPR
jgi:hypothetical protein